MKRLVEYRNLVFESSNDGVLQIWFEAQCNEDNLLVRIYGQDRDTSFERITPQVLTGWALYRSSKPKGLVSGIYASLRPHGSCGGAMDAIRVHLDEARKSELYAPLKERFMSDATVDAVSGVVGVKVPPQPLFEQHTIRRERGGENAE